jgi:hypothetical protein
MDSPELSMTDRAGPTWRGAYDGKAQHPRGVEKPYIQDRSSLLASYVRTSRPMRPQAARRFTVGSPTTSDRVAHRTGAAGPVEASRSIESRVDADPKPQRDPHRRRERGSGTVAAALAPRRP